MVKIFNNFFKQRKRYFSRKPRNLDMDLTLKELREELNEHLDAINQNTSEIELNYEYINEINNKLDKLSERIDQIQLFLQTSTNFQAENKDFDLKPLTRTEQQIFMVIYALEDEKGTVSYTDIGRKTGFSLTVVNEYIARLIEKGIPIIKRYINNIPYLRLNPEFKRLQAMENILMIDAAQKDLVNF